MKTAKATFYGSTSSRAVDIKPKGVHFSYEELKHAVGGMVEIVPLPSGKLLICNEEGRLIGLPVNAEATKEWRKEYPIEQYPHNNPQDIVGDCIITDAKLIE